MARDRRHDPAAAFPTSPGPQSEKAVGSPFRFHRAVLAVIVAAWYALLFRRPEWMAQMGIGTAGAWFVDTRAVLAASDAHALGISPHAHNPLDPFNQPHLYPSWWFGLHALHLTSADTVLVGAVLVLLFLVVALLQVRVRSAGEVVWSALILGAPPVVLACNRANADLLVFVALSALVPCLTARRAAVRWLSPLVVLAGTGMKLYPAIAAVLLLAPTRPRRERLAQFATAAVLLTAFIVSEADVISRYAEFPRPEGFFTFGAAAGPQLFGVSNPAITGLTVALMVGAVALWWRPTAGWAIPLAEHRDHLRFILATIVLVGCYVVTVNYLYRLIFAIWMAPFLWTAMTAPTNRGGMRGLARLTG
ncbi:MAG TPA: hypothetical protein VHE61_04140, partial [Opitutaceae bacterium]|nr:hypothetical protein [Opitutaceae bacterium]